jgi:histone acetyltransferase 1
MACYFKDPGLCDKNEFLKRISKNSSMAEPIQSFGTVVASRTDKDGTFIVYRANNKSKGFSEYHRRMEFFIKFFIDGASIIELSDEWVVFFTIFTPGNPVSNENVHNGINGHSHKVSDCPSFVGYFTAYQFYCAIDTYKSRVSQVLVLPSFQRRGLAGLMLECYYREMLADEKCKQISVESSSFGFQQVRLLLDASNLLKDDLGKECIEGVRKDLRFFPSPGKIKEFQKKWKLFNKQALDVIELVLFVALKSQDPNKLAGLKEACERRIAKMNAQTLEPIQFKTKMPKIFFEGKMMPITPAMFANILSPQEGTLTIFQLINLSFLLL